MTTERINASKLLDIFRGSVEEFKLPRTKLASVVEQIDVKGADDPTMWEVYNAFTNVLTKDNSFASEAVNRSLNRWALNKYLPVP